MKVSIVPCGDYREQTVQQAMAAVLAPLGGLEWVTSGMTIAIKTNLVTFAHPDTATTTHPALLCALIRMLRVRGAKVIVGDSPGGLYNHAFVNRVYAATGMKAVEAAGAILNQNFTERETQYEGAEVLHHFTYTAWLDDADAIIDFCKLKTHGMMGMSAAAKNMFGAIPGTMKPEYHYRFPQHDAFANMIVDLDEYFKPRLSIVDAVIGMEGNGPTAGTPRPIGALAASANPHALDLLCAQLIGIDTAHVPTLQAAIRRNLIPAEINALEICGDWRSLCVSDYQLVQQHSVQFYQDGKSLIGRWSGVVMQKVLASVPKLQADECVGCGECARICPADAIQMVSRRPQINRRKCIRCFCCQEFCPKGAMKVHRPFIAQLLDH